MEIYSEEHISLYDHSDKTQHLRGRCAVTTHRLFYMDESHAPPTALFLPLEWVTRLTKEAGFLARSGRRRARTNHLSVVGLTLGGSLWRRYAAVAMLPTDQRRCAWTSPSSRRR